mgnify:CR=1 FL=1
MFSTPGRSSGFLLVDFILRKIMITFVLCGGSGTRLWPISRDLMPKQFVPLFAGQSLFQKTIERNASHSEAFLIVSNEEQYFLAYDQLSSLGKEACFVLESASRSTAPAIALAALSVPSEKVVLVVPSDHLIENQRAYLDAVARARELAMEEYLVVFGIAPAYPETGFGYVRIEGNDVTAFKEKPDLDTARRYIEQGGYYWNSGMFCFKAGVFLEELSSHSPSIYEACVKAVENSERGEPLRIKREEMRRIPKESIDYAVMEKSGRVKGVCCDIGWSDLGSFESLYEALPKDDRGNTSSDAIAVQSKNNLVLGESRQIALVGIEEMMVVDTPDALLVARKGFGQQVREVVQALQAKNSELQKIHSTVHRPWGSYTVLQNTPGYKVKRIVVKPGKRLSLQKHHHRNEHWVVVSGSAIVTVGEKERLANPNEYSYIPAGCLHRLENPGKIDLVLMEVQVGEYTEEDDIVRVEDDFRRI